MADPTPDADRALVDDPEPIHANPCHSWQHGDCDFVERHDAWVARRARDARQAVPATACEQPVMVGQMVACGVRGLCAVCRQATARMHEPGNRAQNIPKTFPPVAEPYSPAVRAWVRAALRHTETGDAWDDVQDAYAALTVDECEQLRAIPADEREGLGGGR